MTHPTNPTLRDFISTLVVIVAVTLATEFAETWRLIHNLRTKREFT